MTRRGGSRVQGLAVTALAAASFSRVQSISIPPFPFPAMSFFAEEFSDRAFAAVHQRAGDLPANHKVFPPLHFSPSYPRHASWCSVIGHWVYRTQPSRRSRSYLHHPSFKRLQEHRDAAQVYPLCAIAEYSFASALRCADFTGSVGKAAPELGIFPDIQPKVCLMAATQCSNSHALPQIRWIPR